MESFRVEVLCSPEEMRKVFESDPVIIVKFYAKNVNETGFVCDIRYPECSNPIKDCAVFESWEKLRESIMNRRVRYMNQMNKKNAGSSTYVPKDATQWYKEKKAEVKKIFSESA